MAVEGRRIGGPIHLPLASLGASIPKPFSARGFMSPACNTQPIHIERTPIRNCIAHGGLCNVAYHHLAVPALDLPQGWNLFHIWDSTSAPLLSPKFAHTRVRCELRA